ncbi:hypothetical protein [Phytoactinopolyspora endophytica]|uniref:hypothetical protein n=1 Tax=Phytoactinopolyspora endophytica TaxID=1642495 RepID=UPI00101D05FA|nr:hypothetical protein [Phytoactinopolyspora endophytica]
MKRAIMRAAAPLVFASAVVLTAGGAAHAGPGTDDGIYPPPAPPIYIDPDGPGTDDGIYPPPAPPIYIDPDNPTDPGDGEELPPRDWDVIPPDPDAPVDK